MLIEARCFLMVGSVAHITLETGARDTLYSMVKFIPYSHEPANVNIHIEIIIAL